jgi:hypothetical protein
MENGTLCIIFTTTRPSTGALAAYGGNVVKSAERNPIVKPEKKHVKH